MGAVAAARRTQSSFPVYVASTNPSQLQAFDAFLDPKSGSTSATRRPRPRPSPTSPT